MKLFLAVLCLSKISSETLEDNYFDYEDYSEDETRDTAFPTDFRIKKQSDFNKIAIKHLICS